MRPAGRRNENALAVMVKLPQPGRVKTRLAPPLTAAEAARLYRCFIEDTFDMAARLKGVDLCAAYAPKASGDEISEIVGRGIYTIPQEDGDLGVRIRRVFSWLLEKGYKRVSIIGSDSPDLPEGYIVEAYAMLDGADAVIGPANDGGYYLIAMGRLNDALFRDIPWSTGRVLEKTLENAREDSLEVRLLKPWHDIDTPDDLRLLRGNPGAPKSSGFLKMLGY